VRIAQNVSRRNAKMSRNPTDESPFRENIAEFEPPAPEETRGPESASQPADEDDTRGFAEPPVVSTTD
jgi:hypothetical protein